MALPTGNSSVLCIFNESLCCTVYFCLLTYGWFQIIGVFRSSISEENEITSHNIFCTEANPKANGIKLSAHANAMERDLLILRKQ